VSINSAALADAGNYVLTLTTNTEQLLFTYTDTYVLNVVIFFDCKLATWNLNAINDITTSVSVDPPLAP
jgi:hypothetical protein